MKWIPFQWEGDTISGRYIERAYIYVSVKIDDLPYNFTMQLDLGTPQTQFYGKTIKPYLEKHVSWANKLISYQKYKDAIFENVSLHMGDVDCTFNVWHRHGDLGDEIPIDSIHSPTPKHIGTIAADMFQDKIIVIDYKSSKFAMSESLPAEYNNLPAIRFEIEKGVIKLPFCINGKECKLMFDTGSSPFQLVTTKERAFEISDSVIVDSLSGPLWWGQQITFYGFETNKQIEFGGKTFPKSKVYYDKDGLWKETMDSFNIWGITGNAYFFDSIVIIDFKNKLFRVI